MNRPIGPYQGGAESGSAPRILSIGVVALGVISFLLGFAPYAEISSAGLGEDFLNESEFSFYHNGATGGGVIALGFLLAAAVIAVFGLLPRLPRNDAIVAGLSVAGFLSLLFMMLSLDEFYDVGVGLVLVLVSSFLQSGLAVTSALIAGGIIKMGGPSHAGYGAPGSHGWPQPYPPTPRHGQPPAGRIPPHGPSDPWRR